VGCRHVLEGKPLRGMSDKGCRVSDTPATFGARIRELREAAGMSPKQLAWHTGTTTSAVYAWERGLRFPRDATLPLLAQALRTTVEALEGET